MKKPDFVPTTDQLEGRVVLSSVPKFIHGEALLTSHAPNETYARIEKAFNQYADHGQNFKRLETSPAGAVSRIPWNRRDGLLGAVESEAAGMLADIQSGVTSPVKTAEQAALQDVHEFVRSEVAGGVMVVR